MFLYLLPRHGSVLSYQFNLGPRSLPYGDRAPPSFHPSLPDSDSCLVVFRYVRNITARFDHFGWSFKEYKYAHMVKGPR